MKHSHSPAAHHRIRNDHAQETAEDYVEAISELINRNGTCRIADLAERFGVSHVTVIRVIKRLEGEGLVTTEPYRPIELTKQGQLLAKKCQERHEIVYQFLLKLGVSESVAIVDAEGIEHHVSNQTLAAMRTFIKK